MRWERISPTYDHRATSRLHKRPKNKIDVKAIRVGLGLTQDEFAGCFGFSVSIRCAIENKARDRRKGRHALIFS
jgi:DNA-binding transcriptional regulator YiaG